MSIMVAADLHVGKCFRSTPEFQHDDELVLSRLAAACLESKQKHGTCSLILAGDVFHRDRITGREICLVKQMVTWLLGHGIPTSYVVGNHDMDPVATSSDDGVLMSHMLASGAFPLSTTPLYSDGFAICGINWGPRETMLEQLDQLPPHHILVMHTAFKHLLGFDGSWSMDLSADFCTRQGPQSFLICGDIHKYDVRPGANAEGSFTFISPGSPAAQDISETSAHGAVEITGTPALSQIRHIPLGVRTVITVDLREVEADQARDQVSQALDAMLPYSGKPVLALTYTKAKGTRLRDFVKSLEGMKDLVVLVPKRVYDPLEEVPDVVKQAIAGGKKLSETEALASLLPPTEKPEEHRLASTFLNMTPEQIIAHIGVMVAGLAH